MLLQIATESSLSERARLEQRIEDVESSLRTVESEREELLVRLASLKDDNKVLGKCFLKELNNMNFRHSNNSLDMPIFESQN